MVGLLHSGVPVMGTQSLSGCDQECTTEMDGCFDPLRELCQDDTPIWGGDSHCLKAGNNISHCHA